MLTNLHRRLAAEEFQAGKLDIDLWLEALGQSGGDDAESERIYISLRAEQLRSRGVQGGPRLFGPKPGQLFRPSHFLWLYLLLFLLAGVALFFVAATGTLNPNAVSTGPEARVALALAGLLLTAAGAWSLYAARRVMRQEQNTES